MSENTGTQTRCVRAGIESDSQHRAVMPPVHLSTNFAFAELGSVPTYDYSRSGNPTRDALAVQIAALEEGEAAIITPSGMAAITLLCSRLNIGDLLVAPHDCYGGTTRLLTNLAKKGHFDVAFVDQTDDLALEQVLERHPKLVLIETPSNPLLRIVEIAKVSEMAHAVGALVAVDNTFLSPALQKPIAHGADIVLHSTTKYLNGHSDVVGGALIARGREIGEEYAWWANALGICSSPFDAYQTMRGIRTLFARMSCHENNARNVASFLENHPSVTRVNYPGLVDHPGHEIASAQQFGFGGMLSFEIDGGVPEVSKFVSGLKLFSLAESLGGVESLVAHPSTMTHAAVEPEKLLRSGIRPTLLRLSIGIENDDDLIADLDKALAGANSARRIHAVGN